MGDFGSGAEVFTYLADEKARIVDARPEEQYLGSAKDHNSSRRGHIQGAINIPFLQLTREDEPQMFKNIEDLQKVFDDNHIQTGSTIIVYCGSGIWASPVYFAARLLKYKVRFYDGSFQEWGNDDSLPIQTNSNHTQ